jgi:hypothetical protein
MTSSEQARAEQIALADMDGLRAVFDHYLKTGKPVTAKEAAPMLGVSEQKARKMLQAACETWRWRPDTELRDTHSRDYPMMNWRTHKVAVYEPSKEALRKMLAYVLETSRG